MGADAGAADLVAAGEAAGLVAAGEAAGLEPAAGAFLAKSWPSFMAWDMFPVFSLVTN